MGTYNRRGLTKSPQIKFTRKNEKDISGTWFIGTKEDERAIDDRLIVFDFKLESAHPELFFGTHDKGMPWIASDVGPGSLVSYLGGSDEQGRINQLTDKLQQVPKGQRIKVTYLGKKTNEKTNREYNDFEVVDA